MPYRDIPAGAIKIHMDNVESQDGSSCGAAVWLAVALYYGLTPGDLNQVRELLGTTSEHGTYYANMVRGFSRAGLESYAKEKMTVQELRDLLDRGVPCILSIQAWAADPSVYKSQLHCADGHYVIAVGYDLDGYIYFRDPSVSGEHGYMHWTELSSRWHENEGIEEPEISYHLAIVVKAGRVPPKRGARALKIE